MEAINQPKQLLVEGTDEVGFFKPLLKHLTISDIQVQNIQGKDNLCQFLTLLVNDTNFIDSVQSVGIIRDADQNASAAFDSVQDSLKAVNRDYLDANLGIPNKMGTITAGERRKRTGIYILPGLNENSEMLEDLCLMTVENDVAMGCVNNYLDCLQTLSDPPKNLAKAKLQAFLASRKEPTIGLRRAADKGEWNWEHPALIPMVEFLKSL